MNKQITVHELAQQANISIRTLHYYDEIGLLKPAQVKENGYRVYGQNEMLKLQQILFFRELDFPLEQIKEIVNSPQFNQLEALKDHKKMLLAKKERLENLLHTLDNTIKTVKGGEETMSDDTNLYSAFDDAKLKEYQEEARQRWGHTDAYKQSQERYGKLSKEEKAALQKEQKQIAEDLAALKGKDVKSDEVQQAIDRHFKFLFNFYDPSYEMYRGLGQMYVDDKRFTAYYNKHGEGTAEFIRDAINYYCDTHENK